MFVPCILRNEIQESVRRTGHVNMVFGQQIDRGWSISDRQSTGRGLPRGVAFVCDGWRVTNRIEAKGTRARAMNRGIDLSRLGRSASFFPLGDTADVHGGRARRTCTAQRRTTSFSRF